MHRLIQTALEMIYPPRCVTCGDLVTTEFGLCGSCWCDTPFVAGTICETCGAPLPGDVDGHRIECDDCMQTPRPWQDGRAALTYSGRARRMVLALKHGDRTDLVRPASQWMARAARDLKRPDMLIVPVPLHWTRLLRRRYNQSALLADGVAQELGLTCCPDALVRGKRTPKLEGKSAEDRMGLLADAITAHPKRDEQIRGREILLVDDVMTSGATLAACANALRSAGANDIFVLTLARVAKDP